ncbi:hypothetical protein A9Q99_16840 [Gammaproteobacteria bacterium 45_16_T64]|nr:hypothetical protein A9Q99_16840 [Gammaproteobacteria bacterium 45_16_T64]
MDIYEVFITVAESGSFSSAAKKMGFTSSAVSKQISRLEKKLGVQLFARTTRSLALTDSGTFCYEKACSMIQKRREIESEISRFQHTPTGTLRLTSTPGFGEYHMIDIIAGFKKKYPDIKIELTLTGKTEDIVKNGIDIAIREGQLKDSNLLARRLSGYRVLMCASPEFHRQHNIVNAVDALDQDIVLINDKDIIRSFMRSMGMVEKSFRNEVMTVNNLGGIRKSVIAGIGVGFLPDYMVMDDIRAGRLIEIPLETVFPIRDVYAVYSSNQGAPGKVRSFIDYAVEYFRRPNVTHLNHNGSVKERSGSDAAEQPFRYQACL